MKTKSANTNTVAASPQSAAIREAGLPTSCQASLIPSRRFNVLTLSTLLTSALTGCSVLTYHGPSGETFTRSSFGANASIQSLAIETDTNGLRRVELHGYQNETSQALGVVTEAAVKAALAAGAH